MFIKQLKNKIKKEKMSIKTKYSPPVSVVFCAHKAVVFAMAENNYAIQGSSLTQETG